MVNNSTFCIVAILFKNWQIRCIEYLKLITQQNCEAVLNYSASNNQQCALLNQYIIASDEYVNVLLWFLEMFQNCDEVQLFEKAS
ncbi:hypothetical protein T10_5446 [Trichinella papuae]|uniref:Uncharacterized protein n=1 Tax=Trichinella papuae TaxID=268474 RepID=A0A0V1N672_9BILA|nr:hypothetical protein T10_5446 [Trichinella papuae]